MNKEILQILKNYNALAEDILDVKIDVRIGNSEFRQANIKDRLELLREEWFKATEEIEELGYDITN
jgi:hypothetical protein